MVADGLRENTAWKRSLRHKSLAEHDLRVRPKSRLGHWVGAETGLRLSCSRGGQTGNEDRVVGLSVGSHCCTPLHEAENVQLRAARGRSLEQTTDALLVTAETAASPG